MASKSICAFLLLALGLPAQRLDCFPLKLTLPGPSQGGVVEVLPGPNGGIWMHVMARAGVPLLSVVGAAGPIQIKMNLLDWYVVGASATSMCAVWSHLSPIILPLERAPQSAFDGDGGITRKSAGSVIEIGGYDALCHGLGISALGLPWPCDWDSHDGLRSRDLCVDSVGIPRKVGHELVVPWAGLLWVSAWFEVIP